jgi:hypothetical protein
MEHVCYGIHYYLFVIFVILGLNFRQATISLAASLSICTDIM